MHLVQFIQNELWWTVIVIYFNPCCYCHHHFTDRRLLCIERVCVSNCCTVYLCRVGTWPLVCVAAVASGPPVSGSAWLWLPCWCCAGDSWTHRSRYTPKRTHKHKITSLSGPSLWSLSHKSRKVSWRTIPGQHHTQTLNYLGDLLKVSMASQVTTETNDREGAGRCVVKVATQKIHSRFKYNPNHLCIGLFLQNFQYCSYCKIISLVAYCYVQDELKKWLQKQTEEGHFGGSMEFTNNKMYTACLDLFPLIWDIKKRRENSPMRKRASLLIIFTVLVLAASGIVSTTCVWSIRDQYILQYDPIQL